MNWREGFESHLREQDRAERTITNYCNDVSLFARFIEEQYGEGFDPARTVRREVQEYRTWLIGQGASGATINRRLAGLRAFFGWQGQDDTPNPAEVGGMQLTDPGVQSLTLPELRRLMREVHVHRNPRDIAMIELLCGTAMRVGELVALRIQDVEIGERRGTVTVRSGKGRSSREIPLNGDVRSALTAYLANREEAKGEASDWLFLGQRGRMMAGGVWRIVRRYGRYAGIEDLRVHQLRHTALTRMVRDGVDLATVAKVSGHRSLRTLMRYVEASAEDVRSAVEGLVLGETGNG